MFQEKLKEYIRSVRNLMVALSETPFRGQGVLIHPALVQTFARFVEFIAFMLR